MLNEAKKAFFDYVRTFPQLEQIILKKKHTLRVMTYCGIIAETLGMSEEDIEVAKLCGLLHDIGRFEQWIKYGTYVDHLSVSHALLGYNLLENEKFRRSFYKDESLDSIVLCSVKEHSELKIPENISERQELFLKITRDADKLDIIDMVSKNEISVDDDSTLTEEALSAFRENRLIIRTKTKTALDRMASHFAFVYDLNFPISYAILNENGTHLDSIKKVISQCNNPVAKEQLLWVLKQVDNFVSEKASMLSLEQKKSFQLRKA